MKKIIFVVLLGILSIYVITTYNNLIILKENVNQSWGNVQTSLQRRYDLIPNLVNTVKGYVEHENSTLKEIVELRAKSMQTQINVDLTDANSMKNLSNMQATLDNVLTKFMALSESYPDLKASSNFLELQSQLEGTENRINVARTRYNEAVKSFNSGISVFPASIINKQFLSFEKFQYFEADTNAQENVIVKF